MEVDPEVVERPFWYTTVKPSTWLSVAGGKDKLVVKGVRSYKWLTLHTTKQDGTPLGSLEVYLAHHEDLSKTSTTPCQLNPCHQATIVAVSFVPWSPSPCNLV